MTGENGFKPSHTPISEVPPPPGSDITPAAASVQPLPPGRALAAPGAGLALGLLLGINLFNYIDRQVLAAIIDDVEGHFLPRGGASNGFLMGLLATAFMASYMIFAPVFGWLADRVRRWWLVGLGVLVWSLASGASGLSSALGVGMVGYWLFFVTRCFVGVGEAAYGPVAPAVISDMYPERMRGQVLSWFHAAIPVGSALGYTLGGLAGWPLSFYLVVPPGLLLGVFCFMMREPKKGLVDGAQPHTVRRVTFTDYKKLFRTPSFLLDTAGMTCLTFALGGIAYWMPNYLLQYRQMGSKAGVNATFGAVVVVSGLVATLLGGYVSDRVRKFYSGSYFLVSGIAMFLAFPIFILLVYMPNDWIWPLIFLACFLLFFNTGPTNTILANVTHPSLRPAAFALNILIIHALGDAVSPAVIGGIADQNKIAVAATSVERLSSIFSETGLAANVIAEVGQAAPGVAAAAVDMASGVKASLVLLTDPQPVLNGSEVMRRDLSLGFLTVSGLILVGSICWLIGARYLGRDSERAIHQLDDVPTPS
jgi:MFS transporter, Spinster family, sphingosine-1-phosphate transporter